MQMLAIILDREAMEDTYESVQKGEMWQIKKKKIGIVSVSFHNLNITEKK